MISHRCCKIATNYLIVKNCRLLQMWAGQIASTAVYSYSVQTWIRSINSHNLPSKKAALMVVIKVYWTRTSPIGHNLIAQDVCHSSIIHAQPHAIHIFQHSSSKYWFFIFFFFKIFSQLLYWSRKKNIKFTFVQIRWKCEDSSFHWTNETMGYQLRSSCKEAKPTSGIQTFDRIFGFVVEHFLQWYSSKIGDRYGESLFFDFNLTHFFLFSIMGFYFLIIIFFLLIV